MATLVRLLATGGTIATIRDPDGRTRPAVGAAELARAVDVPGVTVDAVQVSQTPSWALTGADMREIALAARDAARDPRVGGVVVTHGTQTLEYTAFLADLYLDTPKPVVFTGAMRRADAPGADGPGNLAASVRLAASSEARGIGAVVCFAGEILAARDVWKADKNAERAFVAPAGAIGEVRDGTIRLRRIPTRPRVFSGGFDERVALVKAYPGAGSDIVAAAVRSGARGLVVEGFAGAAGVPRAMRDALGEAVAAGLSVALCSRAPYGVLADAGGGTGAPLAPLRLLRAGDLTAEKAWTLLSVVLGETDDPERARQEFEAVSLATSEKGATV